VAALPLFSLGLWAIVEGSVSGTITDSSAAAVPGATVTAINTDTNVRQATASNSRGVYSLPKLPVGSYTILVEAAGFKPYRRTGVVVDADSSQLIDVPLVLGGRKDTVTVSGLATHVETADTQLGEVITGSKVSAVPLNGRSFTDLLALQPGVAPVTTITSTSIEAAGASVISPSGDLNPGTLSINGQREYANGFRVDGADASERFTMGAAIIPNLDSIAEFRILTSNFDAQYGNYGGGQIDVVTKSGSNRFHGELFEFLRNTDFDSRNFFSADRGTFEQNQFGGMIGGPIVRNKVFFFSDYQGTRQIEGVDTGLVEVPSLQDRTGDLSDQIGTFGTCSGGPCVVGGQYWAGQLSQKLGYPVTSGENYYTSGCTTSAQCVFPNAVVPQSAWSAPSQRLLQYMPVPNSSGNFFTTSAVDERVRDDKGSVRLDANTKLGQISSYYFIDDYLLNNPYPVQQGGASVPGFNALNQGRAQLVTFSDTKTLGAATVNEAHFSYVRDVNLLGVPVGGVGTSLASQGFLNAQGSPSIIANRPKIEGIENTILNNFTIGVGITGLNQYDNTFEFLDNLAHVVGSHTLRLGGELIANQVNASSCVQCNGTFSFFGSETGLDFADYLLGIGSSYTQGNAQAFYNRNKYGGLFLQDSWRVNPRLTLNYGLRWDVIMPWYEKYNQLETLVPGEQSVVFPGAPAGLVYPLDPGIARSLAPTRWNNLAPRLGLAYSPGEHDGLLGRLLGGPEKTSIRAGFGEFYTAIEGVTAGVVAGNPPYGITYVSPAPPLYTNPFVNAASGFDNGQRFPITYPPLNASPSNPNPNVNFAQFEPVSGLPGYYPGNVTPYNVGYNFSLQRQFGKATLVTASYVGNQSHHLLVLVEANPGNPALCLSVSQPNQVMPGTPTCGPYGESGVYTTASGQVINGTRAPFGPNFGSINWMSTMGNSNFNALELTVRHVSTRGDFLAGYTYSKSIDQASSVSEQVNPLNYNLSRAPSSFDLTHNFVVSYRYPLPFAHLFGARNRATDGWVLTGITRFSTGLPVTLTNNSDNSLLGTLPNGISPYAVDEPDVAPGPLNLNQNPRNAQPYFNTSLFNLQPLGGPGTAARRFFYGPGMSNFNVALLKSLRLTESRSLEFRLEAFNVFNHAQFFGPTSVNGNVTSSTFGQVVNAQPPRLVQAALKFVF
jgi:Carboxypeptidase regulatory-like domain/TonB dependent receptor